MVEGDIEHHPRGVHEVLDLLLLAFSDVIFDRFRRAVSLTVSNAVSVVERSFIFRPDAYPGMGSVDNIDEMKSYLTPRQENEATASYQNTTAIACPVCEESFDSLVVCKRNETSLSLDTVMNLCTVTNDDGRLFLFTHE